MAPGCARRRRYDAGIVQKVAGVSDTAQAVIKCLQPFNAPDCRPDFSLAHPRDRPLWHLYELDNWDKHRALALTEHGGEIEFVFPPGFHVVSGPPMGVGFGGFKRGAVFARFNLTDTEPDVEMYLRTTYDVAFDTDGPESVAAEPVLQTLRNIRSEIRHRVLPSLHKFIPKT